MVDGETPPWRSAMAKRKRAQRDAEGVEAMQEHRSSSFRTVADGLYELRLSARVMIDLLVTLDGELLTFVRVDGELLGELPIMGQA